MSSLRGIGAWLLFSTHFTRVGAFTTYQPICTHPDGQVSFVFIPNSRGTVEIIWACLFAIFACTWTVHHPNLPPQRRKGPRRWTENFKLDLRDFWESTKLAFYAMIAPESIVAVSCSELLSAYWLRGEVERIADNKRAWHRSRGRPICPATPVGPERSPQTTSECINSKEMSSGCSIASTTSSSIAIECKEKLYEYTSGDGDSWTIAEIQFANMGGFTTVVAGSGPEKGSTLYHLTAFEIVNMWEEGHLLKALPRIDEDALYDRSKCDLFLKTLAVVEILWSVTQIITRLVRQLAVSPIELAVLAFSTCAVFIYCFYWMKPKNVYTSIPITLDSPSGNLPSATTLARYRRHHEVHIIREFLLPPLSYSHTHPSTPQLLPQTFTAADVRPLGAPLSSVTSFRIPPVSPLTKYINTIPRIAGYFAAALFGGIHALAWSFPFPSSAEQVAWRCATVYTALYGPIVFSQDCMLRRHRRLQKTVFCVLTWGYVVARLVIIGEMLRSLFWLPGGGKGAFVPTFSRWGD